MKTNHADKSTSQFDFVSYASLISSKKQRKKWNIFTHCIEIRSDSIEVDNFIA